MWPVIAFWENLFLLIANENIKLLWLTQSKGLPLVNEQMSASQKKLNRVFKAHILTELGLGHSL
jgi:hypothetical protein